MTLQFLDHRRRQGLAPGTIRLERHDLRRFTSFCRTRHVTVPHEVSRQLLEEFAVYLRTQYPSRWPCSRSGRGLQATTVEHMLTTVRVFLRHLVREGVLLLDPTAELCIRSTRKSLMDRTVSLAEFAAMVRVVDASTPIGVRDRAMLEVLFGCGLRRAELVALDTTDVDLAGGELLVRRGKGGRSRRVPLAGQASRWLTRYLEQARLELACDRHHTALFVGVRGVRLGKERLGQIVRICAERARVGRRISPHRLRHGFATALVRGGADVRMVQAMLGHTCLTSTERYTVVDVGDLKAVHRRTHPRG